MIDLLVYVAIFIVLTSANKDYMKATSKKHDQLQ